MASDGTNRSVGLSFGEGYKLVVGTKYIRGGQTEILRRVSPNVRGAGMSRRYRRQGTVECFQDGIAWDPSIWRGSSMQRKGYGFHRVTNFQALAFGLRFIESITGTMGKAHQSKSSGL